MLTAAEVTADVTEKFDLGQVSLTREQMVERFANMTAHTQDHTVYDLDDFSAAQWRDRLREHLLRYGLRGGAQVPMNHHVQWATQLVARLTGTPG